MSYDTGFKKRDSIAENGTNEPPEFRKQYQTIESNLSMFQYKIRDLENYLQQIGSQNDNENLRISIRDGMNKCQTFANNLQSDIKNFERIIVPNNLQSLQRDKLSAFKSKLEELAKKFVATSKQIQHKEQLFIEYAQKRNSIRVNSTTQQQESEEELKLKLLQEERKKQQIQLLAETDFQEEAINQRKQEINQIEKIMTDINTIAKDLSVETKAQGEKLMQVDQHVTTAQMNSKQALNELTEAQHHQKKGGKIIFILLAIIVIVLAITLTIIFVKKGKDDQPQETNPTQQGPTSNIGTVLALLLENTKEILFLQ